MAWKMISTNGQVQYNVNEYVVDSTDDLENLPKSAAMGSVALVTSTGEVYIKDGLSSWVAI